MKKILLIGVFLVGGSGTGRISAARSHSALLTNKTNLVLVLNNSLAGWHNLEIIPGANKTVPLKDTESITIKNADITYRIPGKKGTKINIEKVLPEGLKHAYNERVKTITGLHPDYRLPTTFSERKLAKNKSGKTAEGYTFLKDATMEHAQFSIETNDGNQFL